MSYSSTAPAHSFFTSEDLAILQEVFDEVCKANGHLPDTPAASMLARALLAAYENGKRDKEELLAMSQMSDFAAPVNSKAALG